MQDVSTQQSCRRQCPHDARCTLSRHLGQPSRRSTRYADVEANHSGATAEVTENEHLIFPSGHARARSTSNQRNGHVAGVELSKCPRHLAAGSVSLLLCGRNAASVFRGSNMRTEVAGQAEVFRAGSRSSERYSPGRLLRRLSGDSRQRALVSQSDWLFVARSLQIVHLFVEDYAVPGSRWLVRAGADIGGIKQGHGQTRRDVSTEFNPNCSECNPLRQTWQSRGRKKLGLFSLQLWRPRTTEEACLPDLCGTCHIGWYEATCRHRSLSQSTRRLVGQWSHVRASGGRAGEGSSCGSRRRSPEVAIRQ